MTDQLAVAHRRIRELEAALAKRNTTITNLKIVASDARADAERYRERLSTGDALARCIEQNRRVTAKAHRATNLIRLVELQWEEERQPNKYDLKLAYVLALHKREKPQNHP